MEYSVEYSITKIATASVARLGGLPPNWASFDRLGPENNALGGFSRPNLGCF